MKPEQALWKLIKPHVPGHAERIENAAATGTPDVNFCIHSKDRWIENKVHKTKKFDWDLDHLKELRSEQKVWHGERFKQGGTVFLLTRHADSLFLAVCHGYCKYTLLTCFGKPYNWSFFTSELKA